MKRHMLTCESAVKGQVQVVQTGDKYSIEEKFKQFKPILPKPAPDTVMVQHQPPKISPMHLNPPVVMKNHVVFPSASITTKQSGSGNSSQDEDFMSNVIIKTEIMDPEEEEGVVLNDEPNNDASADNEANKNVVKFGVSQEERWHQCEQCKLFLKNYVKSNHFPTMKCNRICSIVMQCLF